MDFLRKNWWNIGGVLAFGISIFIYFNIHTFSSYQLLMYINLVSLFFHQLEEYRIVGTFPGMINITMFQSKAPDRFPLNTNTAFLINVLMGWGLYFLAAIFAEKAVWLGIATIIVSFGNLIAHTLVFNIKGKTLYNAGLATCWLFFMPCIYFFLEIVLQQNLISVKDILICVPLGIAVNIGILKAIVWLADKNTPYIFEKRHLLAKDQIKKS